MQCLLVWCILHPFVNLFQHSYWGYEHMAFWAFSWTWDSNKLAPQWMSCWFVYTHYINWEVHILSSSAHFLQWGSPSLCCRKSSTMKFSVSHSEPFVSYPSKHGENFNSTLFLKPSAFILQCHLFYDSSSEKDTFTFWVTAASDTSP